MKHTTYKTIVLWAFAAIFLSSCDKELDIDLSNMKSKIVMNGIIYPDSLVEIQVSKSRSYFDEDSASAQLRNASLKLFVNGTFKEDLVVAPGINSKNKYVTIHRSSFRPKIGDKIRIEASAGGFDAVWAETTVPMPPAIESVGQNFYFSGESIVENYWGHHTYVPKTKDDVWYSSYVYWVKYVYSDSLKIEGAYRNMGLDVHIKKTEPSPQNFYVGITRTPVFENDSILVPAAELPIYTKDDPIFARNPRNSILKELFGESSTEITYPYFTDNLFKNGSHTLKIATTDYYAVRMTYILQKENEQVDADTHYPSYGNSVTLEIVDGAVFNPPVEIFILAISPEIYSYYMKKEKDDSMDDGSFESVIEEPGSTYSNVHQGIGVVGAMSKSKKRVQVHPYPGEKNTFPR